MRENRGIGLHHVARLSAATLVALFVAACADSGPTAPERALHSTSRPSLARSVSSYSTFITIDVPGARVTSPQGINAGGTIVGIFTDANGVTHGFRLHTDLSTIDTISYPGAGYTDARGISPSGEIVGAYSLPGEPAVAAHGYRLTVQGTFAAVHFPGHLYEFPQRILPDGTILGCRHDEMLMADMHGIMISRAGDQDNGLDNSMNNGATPDRRLIVGHHVTPAGPEAYIIEDGVFTFFKKPGSTSTVAWDINPAGAIAGVYTDTRAHGYVRVGDAYATLDYPGSTATRAFGINAGGAVVGAYVAGGKTHGFLALPAQ